MILDQNMAFLIDNWIKFLFDFEQKLSIFDKKFRFLVKIWILTKIWIFDKKYVF